MKSKWMKNLGCILVVCLVFCMASFTYAGTTERVSVSTGDVEWNNTSDAGSISADGRYVAFHAYASSNIYINSIYVHDRQTGVTEMVSVSSQGIPANGNSINLSISADGRYEAFISYATNLVPGDTNALPDIFVRDRQTSMTERISVSSSGQQANGGSTGPAISADGRYVALSSYADNLVPGDTNGPGDASRDVFVHDRATGATERMSVSSAGTQGNNGSIDPAISTDGRYVAFSSYATNLVPGDTNGAIDVFVHDRLAGTTERVNISSTGAQANNSSFNRPSISGDGPYIVFDSWATNLVDRDANGSISDIFLHDQQTGITELMSVSIAGEQGNGNSYRPSISSDGLAVVFSSWSANIVAGDTNGKYDVFVRNR